MSSSKSATSSGVGDQNGQALLDWCRKLIESDEKKAFFFNVVSMKEMKKKGRIDSLFYFPSCTLSQGTIQMVDKINSYIEKSREFGPKYIRQLVVLFKLLIPIKYGESLIQFPQFCMILYNDCMYIAHELDVISVKYFSNTVETLLSDAAASLRVFAEKERQALIKRQSIILHSYLSECKKFKDVYGNMKQNKRAMEKIINQLDTLKRLWCQVIDVSNGIILSSFGEMLEPILKTMTSQILDITDIGENESQDISTLMTFLIQWISENIPFENAEISKFIPSWMNFRAVKTIMTMSLLEILDDAKKSSSNRKLAGLPPNDLIKLVKAIFQESDKRKEVISIISQSTVE
ncbi:hypothetical protein C9374_003054 [Naegleria lovaniensis]|uniref:Uncharacterized protein n=1 Tax=Naegleria lovaniensis TaxID=51637 RepID=A0AA88GS84_NAELO|nr:uncharacterized protein C9374_003054 [Naegleria lovaniensis]KAG2385905.1 hypothetical protein C9374_003054 [Naegleria lovaniensis]